MYRNAIRTISRTSQRRRTRQRTTGLAGSSEACELRIPDRHVSRRHAAFDVAPNGLRITDLESTNGTFVNGLRVLDAILKGGESILLGETELHVELEQGRAKRASLARAARFGRVFGASPAMRRLYPLLDRLAGSEVSVVIEGETGTGKELVAESIHEASARGKGPFIVFDCTAVPAGLLESHLFGHERGAFTNAVAMRKGVFELAHGGTLLIDEIGELESSLQPKLLRALERGEVQRVGGERWMRVDVRVLAATRRDLDREVQAGRFREDLYFRLAVARVELPPLRARHGDIAMLARHFWRKMDGKGEIPEDLLSRFADYPWPGNVRELRNAVARRVALGDLADSFAAARPSSPPPGGPASRGDAFLDQVLALDLPLPRARQRIVDEFERRYVDRVLSQHHGNVGRAAAASGIARRYFHSIRTRIAK